MSGNDIVGFVLADSTGRKAGRITAVYRYPAELDADWGAAAVSKGVLFKSTKLVDLRDAAVDGDRVSVPHSSATIMAAPSHVPLIGDMLSVAHAAEVLAHYQP